MASSLATDGSEDVQDFLRRMKELNEQRAQEDLEEQRRLEQQILKDRAARAARREERARSISPVKQASPMPSSPFRPPAVTKNADLEIEEALNFANAAIEETRKVSQPTTPIKPLDLTSRTALKPSTSDVSDATKTTPTAIRTPPVGGLSWKGGVSSGLGSIRSRPKSVVLGRGIREPTPVAEQTLSPEDKTPTDLKDAAKLLASKDPSWFKQTGDRGTMNSKALRKNLEDDNILQSHGRSFGLPGMAQPSAVQNGRGQSELQRPTEKAERDSTQQAQTEAAICATHPEVTQPKSPLPVPLKPTDPPRFPETEVNKETPQNMLNAGRSISPTKGLGGFVQSAMLKRSDSLNKRWSTVTPSSARSQFMSSHSSSRSPERPSILDNSLFSRPSLSTGSFSKPNEETEPSPSASPQVTPRLMDKASFDATDSPSKRFSPVKSSWLTNAISKPETPPQFSVTPLQPSWMVEIQKAKQDKSENVARPPSPHKEVAIGGLLRSPAMGQSTKPQSLSQGSIRSSERPSFPVISPKAAPPSPAPPKALSISELNSKSTSKSAEPSESPLAAEKAGASPLASIRSPASSSAPRGVNLKEKVEQKEPLEFRAAANNLKRAQTQKYQASDPLKTNILTGKANLIASQGPQKTEHIDDFKRDLLQKRDDIKKVEKPTVRKPSSQVVRVKQEPTVLSEKINNSDINRESSVDNVLNGSELKTEKKHSAPARLQEPSKPTIGGKFAGKFDPNMMSFLTRGGPPKISKEPESVSTKDEQAVTLSHVNKSRAKGPKRRLPATAASGSSVKPAPKQTIDQTALKKDQDRDELLSDKLNSVDIKTLSQKQLNIPKRDMDRPQTDLGPKSPLPPSKSQSVRSFSKEQPRVPSPSKDRPSANPITSFFASSVSTGLPQSFYVQDFLSSKITNPERIKTLRKEIIELKSGGRKEPISSSREHMLFSESIYLCTHVYGSSDGRRQTRLYLWVGEDVSSSVFEADAQNMARVAAKEANSELESMVQGKETARFIEALGGILVVRRGKSDQTEKKHILCGRSYLGHIVFDEISDVQGGICSGFPYIISAANGTTYLWKGKGASTNEVGCARLIAMDMSATGEIEEVNEGSEVASFWSRIGVPAPHNNKNIWEAKSGIEEHETRLFAFTSETTQNTSRTWSNRQNTRISSPTIAEIHPFSLKDLRADGVYVLDCGVVVQVLAGPDSADQAVAFGCALSFAQNYSTAKSTPAFVSLGQISSEIKHAFRDCHSREWTPQQAAVAQLPIDQVLKIVQSG